MDLNNYLNKSFFLILFYFYQISYSQAPQKMSYQAVIRNNSNALIVNATVSMKISVLQGTIAGTVAYAETQNPSTNANGLVSLEIGSGTQITNTFASINWANGPYFIKTETDPTGGSNYTISGTSQLLSVPYALYSANAQVGGFAHYLGEPYLGGLIYDLYKGSDGLEHGLIVALTESTAQWQTISTLTNANRTWDGQYNTSLMLNSPAATYIATLGTGWYLPSIDELSKLYYKRFEVNKALFEATSTLLSNSTWYWSSNEKTTFDSLVYSFISSNGFPRPKTDSYLIRGVKSF